MSSKWSFLFGEHIEHLSKLPGEGLRCATGFTLQTSNAKGGRDLCVSTTTKSMNESPPLHTYTHKYPPVPDFGCGAWFNPSCTLPVRWFGGAHAFPQHGFGAQVLVIRILRTPSHLPPRTLLHILRTPSGPLSPERDKFHVVVALKLSLWNVRSAVHSCVASRRHLCFSPVVG